MPEKGPNLWGIWIAALLAGVFIGAFAVVSIATNVGMGCN